MVDVLSSLAAVIHTVNSTSVGLESSNHLEGNGNGAGVVKTLSKLDLITLSDVERSVTDIADCDLSAEDTLTVLGSVGVGYVRFDTSGVANVLEGMGGKTTLAAVVVEVSSAIHQLLFREGNVATLAQQVPVGLEGADSGEGPAGSAGALILDGSNNSVGVPFVAVGNGLEGGFLLDLVLVGGGALLWLHESLLGELLVGHVGEVVDALAPGVLAHVVVTDLNEGLGEDLEAEFGLGGVGGVEV